VEVEVAQLSASAIFVASAIENSWLEELDIILITIIATFKQVKKKIPPGPMLFLVGVEFLRVLLVTHSVVILLVLLAILPTPSKIFVARGEKIIDVVIL